jgi:hypothetical protein
MNKTVLNLSWQDVENACIDLSHKIMMDKNHKPDIVIPVLWGGIIPARIMIDIMNIKGFQYLEPQIKGLEQEGGGFCNLWSLFFLELIFLNPNLSTKEVLQKALDISREDPQYLKNVIRGYVKKTEKTIDKFMKRIKETDGFNYKDYRTSNKSIYLEKKTNVTDELLKYYLSIGSKNTQFDLYDEYKKENMNKKDYYDEFEELKSIFNKLYLYIEKKPIEDLNKLIKKLYPKMPFKYTKSNEDMGHKYILQLVNHKPSRENEIYKYLKRIEKKN